MNLGCVIGLDIDVPLWLILILANLVVYYIYMSWNFNYFTNMGIGGPKPTIVMGNLTEFIRKGLIRAELDRNEEYGKLHGIFFGRIPSLTISDPEIIKKVMVKEFPNFINRQVSFIQQKNSILSKLVNNLNDAHWKHVRNSLTPTFSAAKLKQINKQVQVCAEQLATHIKRFSDKDEHFECEKLCGCYAMDVIAYTTYGIHLDSQNDPDNIFITNNKAVLDVGFKSPALIVQLLFPFASKFVANTFPLVSKYLNDFFLKISQDTLKRRFEEQSGHKSKDFVQMMADAYTDEPTAKDAEDPLVHVNDIGEYWTEKGLTEKEIAGSSLIFLFAGYSTVSATMSFVLYCLAVNPDCQERIIEEIDSKLGDKVPTYDDVSGLDYMQQVIDETLRLYPPAPRLERAVKEDITIDGIFFAKDTQVGIPVIALHMDPEIYPDPEKFDPERFTEQAKAERNPYYYLPFGMGPRNCIGMRLALMEMKVAFVYLFQKFRFVPCDKTEVPLKLDTKRVNAKNGVWVKAKARSDI